MPSSPTQNLAIPENLPPHSPTLSSAHSLSAATLRHPVPLQVLRAAAFLPSLLPDPAPSPQCVLQCSLPRPGAPAPLQGKARSWVSPPFSLPSPRCPAQHALLERGTGHSQPTASGGPCQAREDGWQCWFPPSHHGRHAGSTSIRGHSLNLHSPSLMQDRQNRRRQQVTDLSQICWEIIHSTGSVCQEDSMVPG